MEWSTSMALGVKNKSETKGWKRTIDSASVQIRCDFPSLSCMSAMSHGKLRGT